jgi:hypothetical protein
MTDPRKVEDDTVIAIPKRVTGFMYMNVHPLRI